MFSKIFTAASLALIVSLAASSQAQASPTFLKPDVNFATTGNTLSFGSGGSYSLSVSTAAGDQMSIDHGSGFSSLTNSSISLGVEGGTSGTLSLNVNGGTVAANLLTSSVTKGPTGPIVFDTLRVTSSNVSGFNVGALVGVDMLAYNGTASEGGTNYAAKGDVAPIVPEPATMSLVLLGLSGLFAGARRKLSV
jgi:hypothetical protein